jgi:hypothetical protein
MKWLKIFTTLLLKPSFKAPRPKHSNAEGAALGIIHDNAAEVFNAYAEMSARHAWTWKFSSPELMA